jgi:hypothetical protein
MPSQWANGSVILCALIDPRLDEIDLLGLEVQRLVLSVDGGALDASVGKQLIVLCFRDECHRSVAWRWRGGCKQGGIMRPLQDLPAS